MFLGIRRGQIWLRFSRQTFSFLSKCISCCCFIFKVLTFPLLHLNVFKTFSITTGNLKVILQSSNDKLLFRIFFVFRSILDRYNEFQILNMLLKVINIVKINNFLKLTQRKSLKDFKKMIEHFV